MRRIGAHVSIAGGVGAAPYREHELGGNCGQIFSSSPRSWKRGIRSPGECKLFIEERKKYSQAPYAVHATYLINPGAGNSDIAKKSIDALQDELHAAHALGIEYVVFHPGAATSGIARERSISQVGRAISRLTIPHGVMLLLENTAGKGTTLGRTFDELMSIMRIAGRDSVGVCLDTCHAFCAGYALHERDGMDEMISEIRRTVGLDSIRIMHLNDSKHPFDSRKDEHEHIGSGHIGTDGMKLILNEAALSDIPMILETPVTQERGYKWNIEKAKSLIEG